MDHPGSLLSSPPPVLLKVLAKGSAATDELLNTSNPHFWKILTGPSQGERNAWSLGDHVVIYHNSRAGNPNVAEHNFVRGFICAVGSERKIENFPRRYLGSVVGPMWFWMDQNPNVFTGGVACLYQ